MDNKDRRGAATVAFLVGAMAGGITALLFAPQTGAQMRGRLKRGAQDLRDKGKHVAHELEEKTETVTGAMKGAASQARNTYRDELEKRHAPSGNETKRRDEIEAAR